MDAWNLKHRDWTPHRPEILSSTVDGRAIVLDLPAGKMLQDHQVHEGAWIAMIHGDVSITSDSGQVVEAQAGSVVHFAPRERHEVKALTDARLLLILTPWPGSGHPGTMTLEQKTDVRSRAAERASSTGPPSRRASEGPLLAWLGLRFDRLEDRPQAALGFGVQRIEDRLGVLEGVFRASIGGDRLHVLADHDDRQEHEPG